MSNHHEEQIKGASIVIDKKELIEIMDTVWDAVCESKISKQANGEVPLQAFYLLLNNLCPTRTIKHHYIPPKESWQRDSDV